MTAVAIRLPDEMVAAIDRLVADGVFTTRSEAFRTALVALLREHEEGVVDQQIADGYRRVPQTDAEVAAAAAATRALIEEEPW
ncbi:MAG: ribbon-helix-helix domain-containing protein [Actinobacteria bacterium]|nr:ribbon-helix-helix domain-containing protein [Actinomycetota bacterium]MBW3651282.1 ribbon-helix-helix domain-containing protein [Actinomycetota bacterium]